MKCSHIEWEFTMVRYVYDTPQYENILTKECKKEGKYMYKGTCYCRKHYLQERGVRLPNTKNPKKVEK